MGKAQTKDGSLSCVIAAAYSLLNSAQKEYDANLVLMKEQERLCHDLNHILELEKCDAVRMTKVAGEMRDALKTRRVYKDKVLLYEPIIRFMNDPANKKVIGQMANLIGEIRRVENYEKSRHYVPKVKTGGK